MNYLYGWSKNFSMIFISYASVLGGVYNYFLVLKLQHGFIIPGGRSKHKNLVELCYFTT